jgi:hypothetical protein
MTSVVGSEKRKTRDDTTQAIVVIGVPSRRLEHTLRTLAGDSEYEDESDETTMRNMVLCRNPSGLRRELSPRAIGNVNRVVAMHWMKQRRCLLRRLGTWTTEN